ncbi:hypothetical protein EXE58_14205 [Nocardioides seonyuensis]|uniref:ATP synthase protein I n=1 Tax=Nocardioides seonyuensis TaxID=2518371 RepID=A0A4V1BMI6_9ACTN|nr:hypothetical protein [Nocardioides seonyuensis]QBX56502.1 hypothetical protein EXE58_14205 [Nocardioides seonyuensis]
MTTESKQDTPPRSRGRGASPLLGAAVASAVLVVILGVIAQVAAGSAGLKGALAGGGLALVVFLVGTLVVATVARLVPAMSLLIALLTYVLQVVLMGVVVLALVRSDLGGQQLFREWFAGAVISVTMLWLGVQVWLFTRLRIPVYELPDHRAPGGEA